MSDDFTHDWPAARKKLVDYDREACHSFFKLLWKPAYLAASKRTLQLSPPEIEEVASSAIQESWEKLITLDSSQACCAYVAQVAYRRAVSLLRSKTAEKRGFNQTISLHQPLNTHGSGSSDAASATLENILTFPAERSFEISELYELACSALGESERAVIDAFYLEQLSYKEISAQMNIPMGSIGTILARALKELKSFFACNPDLRKEFESNLR